MSEIVSYCCASCGGSAKKIVGDTFECTYCGNTNKIINEKDVISFKSKNLNKLAVSDNEEKKGMSTKTAIVIGAVAVLAGLYIAKHIISKNKRR